MKRHDGKRFWNWTEVKNEDGAPSRGRVLFLSGAIAEESWFNDDVTPKMFRDACKAENRLHHDFNDAYWCIREDCLQYGTEQMTFALCAYPSREAKKLELAPVPRPSVGYSSCGLDLVEPELYRWECICLISEIFPDGIPIRRNLQLQ